VLGQVFRALTFHRNRYTGSQRENDTILKELGHETR
jgi:hypothetical protein